MQTHKHIHFKALKTTICTILKIDFFNIPNVLFYVLIDKLFSILYDDKNEILTLIIIISIHK